MFSILAAPRRITPILTEVPTGPRNLLMASNLDKCLASFPSIFVIESPTPIPCRSAGLPGQRADTLNAPFAGASTIPTLPLDTDERTAGGLGALRGKEGAEGFGGVFADGRPNEGFLPPAGAED